MANSLKTNNNGVLVKNNDGNNRSLDSMIFPSNHQFIIIDDDPRNSQDHQKFINRLPLSFRIDYNGAAENPPELILLINPNNMSVTCDKKINSEYTRGGFIVEEWGDLQDNLQFSGKIGGYYVIDTGLDRYNYNKSPSFKNLMNLFLMYRNNGAIYENTIANNNIAPNKLIKNYSTAKENKRIPKITQTSKNRISHIGDVFLSYDGVSYRGSFDSFSIEETENAPYTLSYKFSFIVRNKIETDKRTYDIYNQRLTEIVDVYNNKPSPSEVNNFNKAIQSSLNTGAESLAQETANIQAQSNNFIDQFNRTKPQDIIGSEAFINNLTTEYVNYLDLDRRLKVSSDDFNNIKDSYKLMYSGYNNNIVDKERIGENKMFDAHLKILYGTNKRTPSKESEDLAYNLSNLAKKKFDQNKPNKN